MNWHLSASLNNPWFILSVPVALAIIYILLTRKKKLPVTALRITAVFLLLAAMAKPELTGALERSRPALAILVDTSGSMQLTKKLDGAVSCLRKLMPDIRSSYTPFLYTFAGNTQKVKSPADMTPSEDKNSTDIAGALAEASRDNPGALSGVLLLSDGNNTAGPLTSTALRLPKAPLICISPSNDKSLLDLSIISVNAPDIAFKGAPLELRAHYGASGARGRSVTISISQGNVPLARHTVSFNADACTGETVFMITPSVSGRQKYTVRIETVKNEITTLNNYRDIDIDVLRDKIRVLYICGRPSYEYSFLRHVLKNDPLVELVSFVILRNPDNVALVAENDLALIPFPIHQLFTRDLPSFDVVIFENFTYQRYGFMPQYLQNLADFVRIKGGGFIMTGGENSFTAGGWKGTAIDGILPAMDSPEHGGWQPGAFRARPTAGGHFIMQLSKEPQTAAALWRQMPELDGCTRLEARKGAHVLFTDARGTTPELAVWDCGKGRVAALGVNTTWRWALQMPTADAYTNFWRNMLRWLAKAEAENDPGTRTAKPAVQPSPAATEEIELAVNETALRRMAQETNGGYFNSENVTILDIQRLTKPVAATANEEHRSLWDTPWLLLAACGSLLAEWYLRKR